MAIKAEWNGVIFALLYLCSLSAPAIAQEAAITPDGTTATSVNSPDGSNFDIDGGDKAGGNLFHSFGNFGVPTGGSANFLNSPDVVNIINRVTGGNLSNIDGLIKAAGNANLFLINPAGIIFGQNARLDIGGSFLGSTADSLRFADGTEFSATNVSKPILTINAPIGLNLRDNPGNIINQSNVVDSTNRSTGLQVQPGKNITLVGGDISLEGGKITATKGRVELGGLKTAGTVNFNDNGSLNFPDGINKGNISLDRGNILAGELNIAANSLFANNSSLSTISGSLEEFGVEGFTGGNAGDVTINASDTISLDDSNINSFVAFGQGDAGDINITTSSLLTQVASYLFKRNVNK
jgi:filamentous hemagglutinin family protein